MHLRPAFHARKDILDTNAHTFQVNKDSVDSGETLTIADGYEIIFGEDFFINGTGSLDIVGQLHIV